MSSPLLETTARPRIKKAMLLRVIAVFLVLLMLGLGLWFMLKPRLPFSEKDYEKAWLAEDDERIFHIYDSLRSKRADLADRKQNQATKALDERARKLIVRMEQDAADSAGKRLRLILDGESLKEDDVQWLERYFAMAGQHMMNTVDEVTASYLDGRLSQWEFQHYLVEVTRIPRLTREYKAVLDRFDTVIAVREQLSDADLLGEQERYYEEANALENIVTDTDFAGLDAILDYLSERITSVWQRYYDEQIVWIRDEMQHMRTYDAGARIKKLRSHFTDDAELLRYEAICDERNPEAIVTWWDPVEHVAVKPLIADHERAFDGDRFARAADHDLLLVSEFERALQQLYDNDYVLVDCDIFVSEKGSLKGFPCPRGKKPLVLVLEDFYASFPRAESGMAFGLDVNDKGQVVGQLLGEDGRLTSDRSFTAIGILEAFIEAHPDFSFNGATGAIAIVSQFGIFGHPVADVQELALRRDAAEASLEIPSSFQVDYRVNRQKVEDIVEALRAKNWHLASGTYARLSLPFASHDDLTRDLAMSEMWTERYTGKLTALYCPFGDHMESYKDKAALFTKQGYIVQSGYGGWGYWHNSEGYVYVSRSFLSGDSLRRPQTYGLSRFFDTAAVIRKDLRPS